MKTVIDSLVRDWQSLVFPATVLLVVMMLGWVVRRSLFRILERWAAKSRTKFAAPLVEALRAPFMLWVLVLGLELAVQLSNLPPRITSMLTKGLLILGIISLTVVAARFAGALVKLYGNSGTTALPVTTLTQSLASLVVATIGVLILLETLDISVTPILTALGVGGLAVALALQDTLSNLFAGFYVSLAGQVRIGDYIKLNSGEEGYVTDISWRSTAMRALPNNLIVVPNAKLAQAIVTNFHLPERRMSLLIPVSVSYENDPEFVEQLLIEEAREGAKHIPGLLAEPGPMVRLIPGFGAYAMEFTLICQVAEFVDQYFVQHEMRKRILKRFRKEGLFIPAPIRTMYVNKGAPRGRSHWEPFDYDDPRQSQTANAFRRPDNAQKSG